MIDYQVINWAKLCIEHKIDVDGLLQYSDTKDKFPWDLMKTDPTARMLFFDLLPDPVKNDLNYLDNHKVDEYLIVLSYYVIMER